MASFSRMMSSTRFKGSLPNLTAGEFAQLRDLTWLARSGDVLRGFRSKYDPVSLLVRSLLVLMSLYAVYLMYCESCKDEWYVLASTTLSAFKDAISGVKGSTGGTIVVSMAMVWLITVLALRSKPDVFLIDFQTYRHREAGGPTENKAGELVDYERFLEISRAACRPDGEKCFTERSMDFQEKRLRSSAIGEKSIFPNSIFCQEALETPSDMEREKLCMKGAREEAEQMMFRAVEEVLASTSTKPSDIGILVVNCSLFCPTPSLSAMIINRFGMREDVLSYNLGGMGCSASVIAVDLAARLLRAAEQGTRALVVSTENITQNWYRGNDRSMLLSNCLFRCGAAALILSNKRSDRWRARFKLLHAVRTHMGGQDECYRAVFQEEDDDGVRGVRLSKQIMNIAGDALKSNITSLGPLVLPASEQLRFFSNVVCRKLIRGKLPLGPLNKPLAAAARFLVTVPAIGALVGYRKHIDVPQTPLPSKALPQTDQPANGQPTNGQAASALDEEAAKKAARDKAVLAKELPPYVPNFTKAFEWICVHTGGRAVIDAIENNLNLPQHVLEPSRLSLFKYGNVSSASIWYELQLIAEHGNMCGSEREDGTLPPPEDRNRRLRKGDRIWQIAFGSGFKCNSAVWKCLKDH
uniref:3-ketoacyl-CoA synthase n=1 Tax=Haptolina brevifila TaxID=156173 RepID=A0A7S2CLW0_9EUKA